MKNQEKTIKLEDPYHTFIIAEAGSNWKVGSIEDDLKRAKQLIQVASKSGADAIKFQTYRSETTYVSNAGKSDYLSKHGIHKNINEIFENLEMPYEMISELAECCEDTGIIFMSTPFSVKDAMEINPYVPVHKVASFEINHVRLLEFLRDTQKPVLISTGACTYQEIDFSVDLIKQKHENIALLQSTSTYPAPFEALNLSVIPQLKSRYNVAVGLSDHSMDPIIAPLVAIGYGATIIEKHFTLDRRLLGPDHAFALVPDELEVMIKTIRKADLTKGSGKKEILAEELELRRYATRSLQAIRNISKGEILQEGINFDVLRPGNRTRGMEARFLSKVNGKKAPKNIQEGDGVTEYE